MDEIRMIALDLDGTLLNSEKVLTPRNLKALEAAASRGIEIVPATGRFYRGMPAAIRDLPFVHYVITMNGAQVFDVRTGESIYSADIPTEEALAFYEYLDTLPVIYDAYVDGWGYMTEAMQQRIEDYGLLPFQIKMIRELRSPVPELKAYLREGNLHPQKMQLFTKESAFRDALLRELAEKYPNFAISSSVPNNIEVNCHDADKGRALLELTDWLGLSPAQAVAFGDGLNDLTMLRAAGIGVAMENGHPDVKASAKMLTDNCDSDGVAKAIEQLLL